MGFVVYLDHFTNEIHSGVPQRTIEEVFQIYKAPNAPYFYLSYNGVKGCEAYIGFHESSNNDIISLGFNRPPNEPLFWDAVFNLIKLENWVLYFHGGVPIVANMLAIQHVPRDLVESQGEVRCVQSGSEIIKIIEAS